MTKEERKEALDALKNEMEKDEDHSKLKGLKVTKNGNSITLEKIGDKDCEEDDKNTYVYKSFPVKKEWRNLIEDLKDAADKFDDEMAECAKIALGLKKRTDAAKDKRDARKNLFWSTVRIDLGLEDEEQLNLNSKDEEIQIIRKKK